jgi:hypothetical protein
MEANLVFLPHGFVIYGDGEENYRTQILEEALYLVEVLNKQYGIFTYAHIIRNNILYKLHAIKIDLRKGCAVSSTTAFYFCYHNSS